jgi:hypothetical protein
MGLLVVVVMVGRLMQRAGSGVPTAPMTSGAQPCMPAAPCGAEEARISRRTMAGRTSAICCATKLPMENPNRLAALTSWLASPAYPLATTAPHPSVGW